jgi:DNA primase
MTDDEYIVPEQLNQAVEYVTARRIDLDKYDFYITDDSSYNLDKRVLIPFYWKGSLIGYTARAVVDGVKPKYHSNYESNYVFNLDRQLPTARFVVVCEGPFDAMAIDGVSVLSNEVSDVQADIIESLGRDVVLVPDWDDAGQKLIDDALEFGWSVSFPLWRETCKDISEAVVKYGKLFVLKSIIDGIERNPVKIKLKRKL